jgi:hypothetical protein
MSGRKKSESDIKNARLRLSINDEVTKEMAQWIQTTTDQTGSAPTDFALRNQTQVVLMQAIKARQEQIAAAELAAKQALANTEATAEAERVKKAEEDGTLWSDFWNNLFGDTLVQETPTVVIKPPPVEVVPDKF